MDKGQLTLNIMIAIMVTLATGIIIMAFDHICADIAVLGVWLIIMILLFVEN